MRATGPKGNAGDLPEGLHDVAGLIAIVSNDNPYEPAFAAIPGTAALQIPRGRHNNVQFYVKLSVLQDA
jgi:uncharacterized protein YbjT (DUF2867 family)